MSDPCNAYQLSHWLTTTDPSMPKPFFFFFLGWLALLPLTLVLSPEAAAHPPYVYTTYNLQEGLAVIVEIRMRGGR